MLVESLFLDFVLRLNEKTRSFGNRFCFRLQVKKHRNLCKTLLACAITVHGMGGSTSPHVLNLRLIYR